MSERNEVTRKIRMSEAIRTPNDKIKKNKKENKKIKEYAYSYVKKFMTRKYGYLGIYDFDINPRKESCYIELYLQKKYKKGGKTRIEILKLVMMAIIL